MTIENPQSHPHYIAFHWMKMSAIGFHLLFLTWTRNQMCEYHTKWWAEFTFTFATLRFVMGLKESAPLTTLIYSFVQICIFGRFHHKCMCFYVIQTYIYSIFIYTCIGTAINEIQRARDRMWIRHGHSFRQCWNETDSWFPN